MGVADPIKPSTQEALRSLRDEGVRVIMLTGDSRTTAQAVACKLGLKRIRGRSDAGAEAFTELAIGALLIVGLWQRAVLTAGIPAMVALVVGTALLQRWDTLTQQMVYGLLYAVLLATRSWDRWSIDARPR